MKTVILHSRGEDTGVVHSMGDALVVRSGGKGGGGVQVLHDCQGRACRAWFDRNIIA